MELCHDDIGWKFYASQAGMDAQHNAAYSWCRGYAPGNLSGAAYALNTRHQAGRLLGFGKKYVQVRSLG